MQQRGEALLQASRHGQVEPQRPVCADRRRACRGACDKRQDAASPQPASRAAAVACAYAGTVCPAGNEDSAGGPDPARVAARAMAGAKPRGWLRPCCPFAGCWCRGSPSRFVSGTGSGARRAQQCVDAGTVQANPGTLPLQQEAAELRAELRRHLQELAPVHLDMAFAQ